VPKSTPPVRNKVVRRTLVLTNRGLMYITK
jgi:hypothetical protein